MLFNLCLVIEAAANKDPVQQQLSRKTLTKIQFFKKRFTAKTRNGKLGIILPVSFDFS